VISHLYFNFDHDAYFPAAQPTRFNWRTYKKEQEPWQDWEGGSDVILSDDWVTQTMGVEWTPAGYRFFQRLDGIEQRGERIQPGQMQVLRKDWIELRQRAERSYLNGNFDGWHTSENNLGPTGKNQYFTHLDDDDPDSVLIQFAVAHRPQELSIGQWGPKSRDAKDSITTRLEIDHVRIFQPKDRYAGMEPVYQ